MSASKHGTRLARTVALAFIIYMITLVILRPQVAADGVLNGLLICYKQLIPSLFPFLVLSSILFAQGYSRYLGVIFYPYIRLLRIRNKRAGACILLGMLGGFAVGASTINTLYCDGGISKRDAELLLCCTVGAGPSFVIGAVGYGLLGSVRIGILLFCCLIISSLISGIVCSMFMKQSKDMSSKHALHQNPVHETVSAIISRSTSTMLVLCGFIVGFSCVIKLIIPTDANVLCAYIISALAEITQGCIAALSCHSSIYLVCGALSIMGLCAYLQISGICTKLSLKPLILSRLIHTPLALLLMWLSLQVLPIALNVSCVASHIAYPYYCRLPADLMLFMFLFCIAIFYDLEISNKKHLLSTRKNV